MNSSDLSVLIKKYEPKFKYLNSELNNMLHRKRTLDFATSESLIKE